MNNSEFIIVGKTEEDKESLVCIVGRSEDRANELLNRMLNNPTEHDKCLMDGYSDFRIEEVAAKDCWWRDV